MPLQATETGEADRGAQADHAFAMMRGSDRIDVRDWHRLAEASCESNSFFEHWYLRPSIGHCAHGGAVHLATGRDARNDARRLNGLLPICRRSIYYGYPVPHLATWMHPNIFCGSPLTLAGQTQRFWRALLDWADRNAQAALFLHLPQLPSDGPSYAALQRVLREEGRVAGIVRVEERAMLRSGHSPGDYVAAAMSGKKRKELRRQRKRLSELGNLRFIRQSDSGALGGWITQFLQLEQAGWKGAAGSALMSSSDTADLFRHALSGAAEYGRLERLSLELDGRPVAMLANFIAAPGVFSYKTAFDEEFARFSPGMLLQMENMDLLKRQDMQWADSCAAANHPMIERIWREKRRMVDVNVGIGGKLRRSLFRGMLRMESGCAITGLEP